jgi:hypothetical protein
MGDPSKGAGGRAVARRQPKNAKSGGGARRELGNVAERKNKGRNRENNPGLPVKPVLMRPSENQKEEMKMKTKILIRARTVYDLVAALAEDFGVPVNDFEVVFDHAYISLLTSKPTKPGEIFQNGEKMEGYKIVANTRFYKLVQEI